ncbi:rhodanese-related sulfurtransferase [Amphibacillus indicireducens]
MFTLHSWYYQYVKIEDPEQFAQDHKAFCQELGLKGRILIANEGINGTASGTIEATQAYMDAMHADPRFSQMPFKIDPADGHTFQKLKVKSRPELVTLRLGEEDINPLKVTGNYLAPDEFYQAMQDENTVVIDARNDYEYDLGHFRGAVRPEIKTFRELPDWIEENQEQFEGKRILTYCTGGIRCEKFSGWLVEKGFDDVHQLHGGIATYAKHPEVKGQLWDGKMYVFDERISVPINQVEHVIVGKDYFDGTPCERYINYGNPFCNRQFISSEENEAKYLGGCSHECRVHPKNRYIERHNLTTEEVEARLSALEEETTNTI